MKVKILILLNVTFFMFWSCSHQKDIPIKGAWKFISVKCLSGDTLKWTKTENKDESGIKIWSDSFYVCIYRFRNDTSFNYSYSGGTYRRDGMKYEETIQYHDMINIPDMIGMKQMMVLEIRNDTLTQIYPVDENGNPMKKNFFIEKYRRLD